MPKNPPEKEKINDLKNFVNLTWEVIRRNPDYRKDYLKFLQNYGLSHEDVKEKVNLDGSRTIPWHPGRGRHYVFDDQKGRFVSKEGIDLDPERCNLPFMIKKWGFACDPDESIHQGPSWSNSFISKEWRKRAKAGERLYTQPLQIIENDLRKLPGVLEVENYPEIKLDHNESEPIYHKGEKVAEQIKYVWQAPESYNLSITINLQAPAWIIRYALEFLVAVCQADLGLERKIEWNYIIKCLKIYGLHQQGYSSEDIADHVDLNHYKKDQALKEDLDTYLNEWGVPQVERCLEDAKKWISQGSII